MGSGGVHQVYGQAPAEAVDGDVHIGRTADFDERLGEKPAHQAIQKPPTRRGPVVDVTLAKAKIGGADFAPSEVRDGRRRPGRRAGIRRYVEAAKRIGLPLQRYGLAWAFGGRQ
jgi:hypothetical protein